MPGSQGFVLRVGDSTAPAGHTARQRPPWRVGVTAGCHRQHCELWGALSPARDSQSSSQPCRLCPAPIGGGGWQGALWMSQTRRNQTRINPSMRSAIKQRCAHRGPVHPSLPTGPFVPPCPCQAVVTMPGARGTLPPPAALGPAGCGASLRGLLGSSGVDEPRGQAVVSFRGAGGAGGSRGTPFWCFAPVSWLCCSEIPARSHVPTDAPSPGIRDGSSP